MLTSIKKILIIIIITFCSLTISVKAVSVVKLYDNYFVSDYANILSPETEQYLYNVALDLENKTSAEVVVVTINSLNGASIEEYANILYNKVGIGKSKSLGVLLLLAKEDRLFRVEVGDGLGGVLPDGKTGRIQDKYIIPYLKNNNWDEGITNGFNAIVEEIANEFNVSVDFNAPQAGSSQSSNQDIYGFLLPMCAFSSIYGGMIIGYMKSSKRFVLSVSFLTILTSVVLYITQSVTAAFPICAISYFLFLLCVLSAARGYRTGRSGYYSGGSHSSGGFSSSSGGGHSFGGGGHSSGGGSTRGF